MMRALACIMRLFKRKTVRRDDTPPILHDAVTLGSCDVMRGRFERREVMPHVPRDFTPPGV